MAPKKRGDAIHVGVRDQSIPSDALSCFLCGILLDPRGLQCIGHPQQPFTLFRVKNYDASRLSGVPGRPTCAWHVPHARRRPRLEGSAWCVGPKDVPTISGFGSPSVCRSGNPRSTLLAHWHTTSRCTLPSAPSLTLVPHSCLHRPADVQSREPGRHADLVAASFRLC